MNLSSVHIANSLLPELRREFAAWGNTEGKGWLFVFKTTLAALLAMGISMRFELGQPVTAMVTVYVLMQPHTGMVTAFVCKFFVMTSLDGFALLCAGMVPFMLVGPYLSLNPKLATMGLGYSTMFCFMTSPANTMQYDPVSYVNFGSALMLGLADAAVIFSTFAPVTGAWFKRRTARLLQRQAETACFGALPGLTHRFESGTRDILQRLAATQNLQDAHDRNILDWMFVVLEIGRAVIHLRQEAESVSLSQPLLDSVNKTIRSTASLFRRPDERCYGVALESVEESIAKILLEFDREDLTGDSRDVLQGMLTSLHLIRTSLLDDETVLAATVTRPRAILQGESAYAA